MVDNMLKNSLKLRLLTLLTFAAFPVFAQSTGGTSPLLIGMVGIIAVILLFVIIWIADRLLGVTAQQLGVDNKDANYSIFPRLSELFGSNTPTYLNGGQLTVLKKGYDIPLKGAAEAVVDSTTRANRYAIKPTDFIGLSPIPKMVVGEGDEVKAGDLLFFDKKRKEVHYCAPVSGQIIAINRGSKRKITEVVILADKTQQYRSYDLPNLATVSRHELVAFLLESGVWPLIRQRPFNIMPEASEIPKNIFVSTFDSAPLAPNGDMLVAGNEAAFQKGLEVLAKLTNGSVYLGLNANGEKAPASAFANAAGVEKRWFKGAHPAGNVGVQIHHIAPINKGEVVWTAGVQEVITIGKLFTEGKFDTSRLVAITGAELKNPKYIKTYQGAAIKNFLEGNVVGDNLRYVAGDVLTGQKVTKDSFLGFFDDQVTVLQEGNYNEMFGWLLPLKPRPSISKTFPHFAYPEKFVADTNTHGEHRAFVVTGQYESVTPMDIYPQHLIKSIMMNDLELMEGLGIYEVVEEDLALCEFVCTSKTDVQRILREGLDEMREQG